ncbi:DHHA1 domain-containing protein [Bradyrhizobium sp. Tv2a-2]|uniref:DHHA1 domain-containing protein n=1 Tax=Bradyrhizobium sp. Tv2a-2 TaxID=113395 RepID=UPI00042513B4|nr:DHHA1 domain-containing protein [Bradyrhizobium sp. Tv2a-2]
MKTLCIYHGGCPDGYAAAWCVRKALGDAVEFYPGVYQKDPPPCDGRDVILVDFSYKAHVLHEMASKAATILILDHHKTAQEDLASLPPPLDGPYNPAAMLAWQRECNSPNAMHALFDMDRSGAAIAWDYFVAGERPDFIEYVQDRDLWRKQKAFGDQFSIALASYPQDFMVWDMLIERGVSSLIEEGYSINRYYRQRVEELKSHAYMAKLGNHLVCIANAPYFAASEVAGELSHREGAAFGACYFEVEPGKFQYSLRSRGDFDVSAVAKQFGGGGHKAAAGFALRGVAHRPVDSLGNETK